MARCSSVAPSGAPSRDQRSTLTVRPRLSSRRAETAPAACCRRSSARRRSRRVGSLQSSASCTRKNGSTVASSTTWLAKYLPRLRSRLNGPAGDRRGQTGARATQGRRRSPRPRSAPGGSAQGCSARPGRGKAGPRGRGRRRSPARGSPRIAGRAELGGARPEADPLVGPHRPRSRIPHSYSSMRVPGVSTRNTLYRTQPGYLVLVNCTRNSRAAGSQPTLETVYSPPATTAIRSHGRDRR